MSFYLAYIDSSVIYILLVDALIHNSERMNRHKLQKHTRDDITWTSKNLYMINNFSITFAEVEQVYSS